MVEEIHKTGTTADRTAFDEPPSARFDRADWVSFTVTTFLLLAIYLITLAPDVTLENAGYFATAAKNAGVPSPPGYPLWTVYSWLFTKLLPFSNLAWRVAAGSAFASASACGIIALIVSFGGGILMKGSSSFAHLTRLQQKWLRTVCGYV